MLRLVVLLFFISLCCAEDISDLTSARKKHGYHHLYYGGGLYYLAFLAIKVKIAILIGLGISAVFFFGKIFALIKYAALYLKSRDCPETKEKIVVEQVPYYHDHYTHSTGPDLSFNGHHEEYYDHQSRSIKNRMLDHIYSLKDIIKGVDLTEMAFEQMNIKSDLCKKRFICEVDHKAKQNTIFGIAMYLFSDKGLDKYRSGSSTLKIQDCARIYKDCPKINEK